MLCRARWILAGLLAILTTAPVKAEEARLQPDVRIPLRDGVKLSAIAYLPAGPASPAPCIFTLTPYTAQAYHDRGMYFATHGYPFLSVDVRGRGDSEGSFRPLIQEAKDGYDVVEWLARQPYCNGKVAMWGGSYAGYDQWATAKERPPHLATIVPAAAPYVGVDFPSSHQVFSSYLVQWLTFTSGHAAQEKVFSDQALWNDANRRWYESGAPFRDLDKISSVPLATFQEWLAHPEAGDYWDAYNPTSAQYAALDLPILTITGMYDDDQGGALANYRAHMRNAGAAERARHFLVIGPWDHAGTRTPKDEVGGVKFGPASLLDLPALHLDWYGWTMAGGRKPPFLKAPVAYYVAGPGAESWRYADSLETVTREMRPLYLGSKGSGAADVLSSGLMTPDKAAVSGGPDRYVYDPRDVSTATEEAKIDFASKVGQELVYGRRGRDLVFHSAPMAQATDLCGTFRLEAWLGIDQPDTDFAVSVSEVRPDGSSVALAADVMRARYREGDRTPKLLRTSKPQLYSFQTFNFIARRLAKGSRLRLVIGPLQSINSEKNYNAGGVVAEETVKDARPVTVRLYHDARHPSALYLPIGAGGG